MPIHQRRSSTRCYRTQFSIEKPKIKHTFVQQWVGWLVQVVRNSFFFSSPFLKLFNWLGFGAEANKSDIITVSRLVMPWKIVQWILSFDILEFGAMRRKCGSRSVLSGDIFFSRSFLFRQKLKKGRSASRYSPPPVCSEWFGIYCSIQYSPVRPGEQLNRTREFNNLTINYHLAAAFTFIRADAIEFVWCPARHICHAEQISSWPIS